MSQKTEVDRYLELLEWLRSGYARRLREAAAMSRPMMAEELKCTRHSILNWELGRTLPQRALAYRYHQLLERLAEHVEKQS